MKGTELERIEQQAGEIIQAGVATTHSAEGAKELYFLLGGQDAIGTIADNLNAALIFNYQRIRDEKLYLLDGYQRFDEFMDNHPKSRMSYKRFNYIEGVFNSLGPVTFDLMSGSGLSMRQMKALGKGTVNVEGEHLVLVGEDGEQESIEIANRRQWLDAVTTLAKAKSDSDEKIKRQQKTIESQQITIQNAHEDLDRERSRKASEFAAEPHMIARVEMNLALSKMTEAAEKLSDIEKAQFRDAVLEDLARHRNALVHAYLVAGRAKAAASPVDGTGLSDEEFLDALLDNVVIDDTGNNDSELADQL